MIDKVGNTVTEDGTKLFEIDICTTSSLEILGSADSWRHGLNLMANQLPKQSWLHDFAQNKSSYHSSREHSISRGLKVFSLCDAPFWRFLFFFQDEFCVWKEKRLFKPNSGSFQSHLLVMRLVPLGHFLKNVRRQKSPSNLFAVRPFLIFVG